MSEPDPAAMSDHPDPVGPTPSVPEAPTTSPGTVPRRATLGVEEEFHIIDPATGMLVPQAGRLLARLDDTFTSELHQSSIESRTQVCTSLDQLRDELVRTRGELTAAADAEGLAIVAAGTVPLIDPTVQEITDTRRFRGMLDDYQHLVREQVICSCQVHVGVDDMDQAVAIMNRVRPWLGVLLALSASSPYWEGRDTGYVSYRTQVWRRWPTAGVPGRYEDWQEYQRVGDLLERGGSVDQGMFYWDVRPAPATGTIEFRIADACTTIDDVLIQAALCRALVRMERVSMREGLPEAQVRDEILKLATWRAARFGLAGALMDPAATGAVTTDRAVRKLMDHVRPAMEDAGDWPTVLPMVEQVLQRGSSAQRQRALVRDGGDLRDVVAALAAATRPEPGTGYGVTLPHADAKLDPTVDAPDEGLADPTTDADTSSNADPATEADDDDPPPTVDDVYVQIIIDEAVRRGVRVEVLDAGHGELLLVAPDGRRTTVRASLSEQTSAVAAWRCQDKDATRRVLTAAGIRVPRGRLATFDDGDEEFLADVGQLVVKPVEGQTGDGVTVGVRDAEHLATAIAQAREHGPDILLEERVVGDDLRVMVIGGEVVAAAVRTPATVTGDGDHTIGELVADGDLPVEPDEATAAVADQQLDMDDVPGPDDGVALSTVANVHRGGSIDDVTDRLSDELRAVCVEAADAIGIPVAGVDLMVPDVTGTEYAVIEVNERPGLANHEPHPVVQRWFDVVLP